MTVYLPCLSGVTAVRADRSPAALHLLWTSGSGGGPPILAAGLVWTIGQNGNLYGLSPATGAVRQQASIGTPANHFPTPSAGDGLLLAPSARDVVAFRAGSGFAVPATPAPSSTPAARQPGPAGGAGTSGGVIAGVVAGCAVVLGGAGWFLWRRRTAGRQ
jgi:hypothetical protein